MSAKITRRNPRAIDDNVKRLKKLRQKVVAVGFPKGKAQAYPDGTSVISVAKQHVFGIGVPQRDFMALAMPDVAKRTKRVMRAIVKSKNVEEATALQNAAGLLGQAAIQQAITDLDTPPNAPATIAAKGSSNPLIDTSHMKQAVTYVVRNRK